MDEQKILQEDFVSYYGLTDDEFNLYYLLLQNCIDVCDSKMGLSSFGNIVKLKFIKSDNKRINVDALLTYETENRTLNGYIYDFGDIIDIKLCFTRLMIEFGPKEYTTSDKFIKIEGGYEIQSNYSFDSSYKYKRKILVERKVK